MMIMMMIEIIMSIHAMYTHCMLYAFFFFRKRMWPMSRHGITSYSRKPRWSRSLLLTIWLPRMKLERISPGHHQTQMNDEFTTATIRKENVPSPIYLNITCSDIINSIDKIRVYGVVILYLTNYSRSIKSIMIVVMMQMIISLLLQYVK